jgi:TolA-binding protein
MLTSCGWFSEDKVPSAGSLQAENPKADQLLAQAEQSISQGKSRRARKNLQEIIKVYPLAPNADRAHLMLGELYESQGNPIKAFESYAELAQKYPASRLYSESLRRQERIAFDAADGEIKSSFLGLKTRYPTKKIAEMLESAAENAAQSDVAAKARYRIGELYSQRKNDDAARSAFLKVVDTHPYSSYAEDAQFQIGEMLIAEALAGNQDLANLNAARDAFPARPARLLPQRREVPAQAHGCAQSGLSPRGSRGRVWW